MIKFDRIEAAKLLISCKDSTKKPHLLQSNKSGQRPYMLALQQYEECRQRLKIKDDSLERVHQNKKVGAISEV